jgi:hypothetical protein
VPTGKYATATLPDGSVVAVVEWDFTLQRREWNPKTGRTYRGRITGRRLKRRARRDARFRQTFGR